MIPFKKPWIKTQATYQAVWGRATVLRTSFTKFGEDCKMAGSDITIDQRVIESNPEASDGQHPHMFQEITMDRASRESLLKLHPPKSGWVVLDDCVTMDCDGPKHILLNDVDGTLLDSALGGGSIISRAEYFSTSKNDWHGRDPKTLPNQLLVGDNGNLLQQSDVVDEYGIVRTGCTYQNAWNGHLCQAGLAMNHRMLVVESLDGDHETRALVPLALVHGKTVDLMNAGMDHGWCFGYTCLKRLMMFNAIVSTNKEYSIYFGATNPQKLRLHLLNARTNEAVVLKFVYTNPQRLAVFNAQTGQHINDLNYQGNKHRSQLQGGDSYVDQWPTLSSPHGTNGFNRSTNTFSVTVRGAGTTVSDTQAFPLTIETLPIIQVSMTMAVSIENFYEDEFVNNIAYLLNIDKERVRVVSIVAGSVGVDLEIGPPLCSDFAISGNESDVDCGQDCDTKCKQGKLCNSQADCESLSCDSSSGTCAAPSCNDGLLSPSLGESDIDCGGLCSNKCATNQACTSAIDCLSGRCLDSKCAQPSCHDNLLNQNEVDIDCGGSGCPSCAVGLKCQMDNQCTSRVCLVAEGEVGSCLGSSCGDGVLNGQETCVDGGGSGVDCDRCASGLHCLSDADCQSFKCTLSTNVCAVGTAKDERKNNEETFVDCGGPNAPACRVGQSCLISRDCESKHCNTDGVCVQATCSDSIKNSDESSVDCGGSRCSRCLDGNTCTVNGDCVNLFCRHYITSTCKPADCGDGLLNGDETCVDGGGGCGSTCPDGTACNGNNDCINGKCESNVCVAASCVDNVFQSATESDQDCGKQCNKCVDGKNCVSSTDCIGNVCTDGVCSAPTCVDNVKNGKEKGIDCGNGTSCPLCSPGFECEFDADCLSSNCNQITRLCEESSCVDGILNGQEGCIDGGVHCLDQCLNGETCGTNFDCVSGVCGANGVCAVGTCNDNVKNQDEGS